MFRTARWFSRKRPRHLSRSLRLEPGSSDDLPGIFHRSGFPDHGDFDLARILQGLFDLFHDVVGQLAGSQIVDSTWRYENPYLPSRLDRERLLNTCLLYTSPSPRDGLLSR